VNKRNEPKLSLIYSVDHSGSENSITPYRKTTYHLTFRTRACKQYHLKFRTSTAQGPLIFEAAVRTGPPQKYIKTQNWSETSQIASDCDKTWAKFDSCSKRL
jgi:hypothetical protein